VRAYRYSMSQFKCIKPGTAWQDNSDPDTLFASYRELHTQLVQQQKESKYLMYVARYAGMGNRLLGIVSSYALALLTRRALIVEWTDYTAYLSDLFEPPGFAWDITELPSSLRSWLQKDRPVIKMMPDMRFPGVPVDPTGSDMNSTMDSLLCSNLEKEWSSQSVVVVATWTNLLPFVYSNPHYRSSIEQMFGSTENVFAALAREVLRPAAAVRQQMQLLPQDTIAMHIRTEFEHPPRFQMTPSFEATFFSCARRIATRSTSSRFVLFTERPATHERAHQAFGSSLLKTAAELQVPEGSRDTERRHGGYLGATPHASMVDRRRAIKAATDLWQLASARWHVISPWSTFSSVALALSNSSTSLDGKFVVISDGVCVPILSADVSSHAWVLVLAELNAREVEPGGQHSFAHCISRASLPTHALHHLHSCYSHGCWAPWYNSLPDAPFWADPTLYTHTE